MRLIFHPASAKQIEDFIASPSHALLITGPVGAGKGTAAAFIASRLLDVDRDKLADHPYVRWLHEQDKGISIDDIREAQNFLKLKTPGDQSIRRVLIVEQGETMSREAQNAFLKVLEEPPADTAIIITATGPDQVLPTIRSRTQQLQVLALDQKQLANHYKTDFSDAAIIKAFYVSDGYIGVMQALLEQNDDHALAEQIKVAKNILAANLFDRLCLVDEIVKQKNLELLLYAMERVSHAALMQSAGKTEALTKRWNKRLSQIITARQALTSKAQAKLLMTDLMLSL